MKGKIPRREINGILLLDKPLGCSSNQALQQVKRLYRAEKAGHTGSLDPLATGLLPLCFGQATKVSSYLLDADKRYLARLRFGEQTATGDAEGEIVRRSDATGLTREAFEQAMAGFLGLIHQVPPMYSALKRDGQPLYRLARQGIEVDREAREIRIHRLELRAFAEGECELDVTCSKGTYIRTLAEDLAAAVGQCAHLTALRRTELGSLHGTRMYTLEELEQAAGDGTLESCLIDPVRALAGWVQLRLEPDQIAALSQGRALRMQDGPAGPRALLGASGQLLGLADMGEDGMLAPRRWLAGGG